MLDIRFGDNGEIVLSGRFDASQEDKVRDFLEGVTGRREVDCGRLDYISSAGLGVLVRTQKRLSEGGGGLKLVNLSKHIRDIFRYSGLERIFEIQPPPGE